MNRMRACLPFLVIAGLVNVAGLVEAKPSQAGPAKVRVYVVPNGEQVEIRVAANEPFEEPVFRSVGKPAHLQLALPHCSLISRPGKHALDRGVLQNINVEASEAGGVTIDLYALSTPQSKASWSPDHQSLLWNVMTNVPASGNALPALHVGSTAVTRPAPMALIKPKSHAASPVTAPVAVAPVQPQPTAPAPVVAPVQPTAPAAVVVPAKPTAPSAVVAPVRPTAPAAVVASVKPTVPAQAQPVARAAAPRSPGERPVSFTYNGGDLAGALTALAKVAGIEAQIDPSVRGYVNASYTDVPLNQVITSILGKQTELYQYKLTSTSLQVFGGGAPGGATVHPVASLSGGTVSDYFPVKQKPVAEVYQAVMRTFPELTYQVDERLNVLFAEGDPVVMERLRKLLQNVSAK